MTDDPGHALAVAGRHAYHLESWLGYRESLIHARCAFDYFDLTRIVNYGPKKIRELANEGIVRNRLKIESAIRNAAAFLKVQKEFGTFERYIWNLSGINRSQSRLRNFKELPARTEKSGYNKQRLEGTRVQFCRFDDYLRVHAGGWHGQRPHHRLLPARPAVPEIFQEALNEI